LSNHRSIIKVVSLPPGLAYQGQGDAAKAKKTLAAAANFNALSFSYAYVRKKAEQALAKS
jgi:hypothetical protein